MKPNYIAVALAAALASAACNAEKGSDGGSASSGAAQTVAPPEGGDWTQTVTQTPQGGYLMGNPNAEVKLVEFASMTCPHCAVFDAAATGPLAEKYVKTGQVAFEFRNFVRDPFDLAASLIARCGGTQQFYPLTHALFESQDEWIGRIQSSSQEQQQAIAGLPPERQFLEVAKLAGFQQWAAQRGLPSAKSSACLTNDAEINRLVQMNSDITSEYPQFRGTPSFAINGELIEDAASWEALEPKIRDALGS